jgi:hypothetical protein
MPESEQSDYQVLVTNLKSSLENTSIVGTIQAMLLQVVDLQPGGGGKPDTIEMTVRVPEIPTPGNVKIVTKLAVFDRRSKQLIGLQPK